MAITGFFRASKLRADCGGKTKTHGSGTAGSEPVIRLQGLAELRGPHLMLTHVGCDDGAALRHGVQLIQNMLHLEAALLLVLQRILLLVAVQVLDPLGGVKLRDMLHQLVENEPRIADAPVMHADHLVDLGIVDVQMNADGVFAEAALLPDDAVVKARADGHDQVALDHRFVGVGRAMHSQHSEGEPVRFREGAFAQQCGGDRRVQLLGQVPQRLRRIRDNRTMAGEQDRPPRLAERFSDGQHLVLIEGGVDLVSRKVHFGVQLAGERPLGNVLGKIDQDRTQADPYS